MAFNVDVSEFLRRVAGVWEECMGACRNAQQFAQNRNTSAIGAAMEMKNKAQNQEAYKKAGEVLSSELHSIHELRDAVDHGLTRSGSVKK